MNLFSPTSSARKKEGDPVITPEVTKVEKQADIVTAPANYGTLFGDGATRPLPEDALIAFYGKMDI